MSLNADNENACRTVDNSGTVHPARATWFHGGRLSYLLVAVLLLMVMLLLYNNCRQRYGNFVALQQHLMEKSATDTAQVLRVYIEQTQRNVALFARAEHELILKLAHAPDDELAYQQLSEQLQASIPDYFAFTIADDKGEPLLDDFDGKIGEICLQDIAHFNASKHPVDLLIHPNTLQYHFDVMTQIELGEQGNGIFFVSFKPAVLSRLLANSQTGSHQIMLLHKDNDRLIELTSAGSRASLKRSYTLSDKELGSIRISHDIPGTMWRLVYVPDTSLYNRVLWRYRIQALEIFAIVLAFSLAMIVLIKRVEKARKNAELALREACEQLDERVKRRTAALDKLNKNLQREVLQRKQIEKQLQHDALHDGLTGLPNRNLFLNHLNKAVKTCLRDPDYLYAVMFIDLDDFKQVNDTMGHDAGDELLKTIASRLLACVRPGDTLARFGGDEFVALITNFNDIGDLAGLARRMNDAVARPMEIHQHTLIIRASTGIAIGSQKYTTTIEILRDADKAMYEAKESGSGKYIISKA